jgi:hypothetical protein
MNDFAGNAPVWLAGNWNALEPVDRRELRDAAQQKRVNFQGILPLPIKLSSADNSMQKQSQALTDIMLFTGENPPNPVTTESSAPAYNLEQTLSALRSQTRLPTYRVHNPAQIIVLPRIKGLTGDIPLVVHVVNTGPEKSQELIWLTNRIFRGQKNLKAKLYCPAREPLNLSIIPEDDGVSLVIPQLREWAVIAFEKP